ncbi:MAG: hypothetical protein LBI90_08660 [Treponema sp.]|jgi:hypothetical protein|nr:hypothetical protein [Treponema sp.]
MMEISINGEKGGITLEQEKTAGEVLSGLENWLRNSGHRLSGIKINEELVKAVSLGDVFDRDLGDIENMDILTSSWAELAADALAALIRDLCDFEESDFQDRSRFAAEWIESPSSRFLSEEIPEIHAWASFAFSGQGYSPPELKLIAEERLRELGDPRAELGKIGKLVEELEKRLEDLPLDFQTGKDRQATETIQIFSAAAEKIMRIYAILKVEGYDLISRRVEDKTLPEYVEEFNTALRELAAAYEAKDMVLAGDIAEYELAPRLTRLFAGIKGD